MPQRKAAVYIDFDKTISPIHGFTESPSTETINAINILYEKYFIIIFSCRGNLEICDNSDYLRMEKYLKDNNIPYDDISRNKPLYAAIIDDRAFNPDITPWSVITKDLMERIV